MELEKEVEDVNGNEMYTVGHLIVIVCNLLSTAV